MRLEFRSSTGNFACVLNSSGSPRASSKNRNHSARSGLIDDDISTSTKSDVSIRGVYRTVVLQEITEENDISATTADRSVVRHTGTITPLISNGTAVEKIAVFRVERRQREQPPNINRTSRTYNNPIRVDENDTPIGSQLAVNRRRISGYDSVQSDRILTRLMKSCHFTILNRERLPVDNRSIG